MKVGQDLQALGGVGFIQEGGLMQQTTIRNDRRLAVLDAVEFGLFARFGNVPASAREELRRHLQGAAGLTGAEAGRWHLAVPVVTEGRTVGTIDAVLFVKFSGKQLVIGSGSSVRLNPLRWLRQLRGEQECGEKGLDGNDNVVGGTIADPAALQEQLMLVRTAFDALARALMNGLPEDVEVIHDELKLRSAEACVDLGGPQARQNVQWLQRAALAEASSVECDIYRTSLRDGPCPEVRWRLTATGPVNKVYQKRDELVRAEIACPDRRAVAELCGRLASTIGGDEAAEQLAAFADAADPALRRLVLHVLHASRASYSRSMLSLRLRPLRRIADCDDAGTHGTPSIESAAAAGSVLDDLITSGRFEATQIPKEWAVRKLLDRLCDEGVLAREGRRAIYCLHPSYAAAAFAAGWAFRV